MIGSAPILLLVTSALFVGFVASGSSVASARKKQDQRRRRLARVLEAHGARKTSDELAPIVVTRARPGPVSVSTRIAALFGLSVLRGQLSPLPVPVIIAVTLALSLAAAWLASAITGRIAMLLAIPLWPILSRLTFGWFEARRTRLLFKQFPDALAMIVRGVRVGIPVTDSIRAVGTESAAPTGGEFSALADELTIGVSLEEALRALAARNNLQEYRFFATAVGLQSQTGGRLSETLENLADVIRKRVAVRARGHALSAEARMSAMILAGLPFVTFAALLVVSPGYVDFFFDERTGHMMLAGALFDIGFGMFVMRTLIQRALS